MKVFKQVRAFNQQIERSPFVFPLALIAALAMIFIVEVSYQQAIDMIYRLDELRMVRMNLRNLQQGMVDAETGQRGYLLTDQKTYREPYERSLTQISAALEALTRYFNKYPRNQALYKKLHSSAETKLSELALTIRLHDEGKADASKADASKELMLSGIGKESMDDIRSLTAELLEQEGLNYAAAQKNVFNILLFNRIGVTLLTLASLLGLFMYLRQSRALEKKQEELRLMVQGEHDRLETEVAMRTAQLTELALHLQNTREDERSRLARDLHDELGALFTSAKLDAARIKSRLGGQPSEILERLGHLVETLNSGIALKRRIIEDLRPSALSNLGLVATLQILTREFAERSGLQVHSALEPVQLAPDTELVVYRLVQEAITNISKYAQATTVWVSLSLQKQEPENHIEVSVRDNGIGFDTSLPRSSAHGLVGMRFRIEAEKGTLHIQSAPGQGTLIQARLPEVPPDLVLS